MPLRSARPAPRICAPAGTRRTRRGVVGLAGVCALAVSVAVSAPPVVAQAAGVVPDADGNEILSSALTREALAVLAETAPGGPAEGAASAALDAAAVLMNLSAELSPTDSEMQWLRADLAERRGDSETLREALGAYLRERPADDAALLKAALLRVAEEQTLDGRLERMRDIIDRTARAGQRTAAMRSRLSMLASAAAAELGDQRQSVGLLGSAATLDPANADAAAAVYARLRSAGADAKRLGAAAANWVFAAPVDPAPRLVLARVLASEGANEAAAEQFDRGALFSGNAPLDPADVRQWAACLSATDRRGEAAQLLAGTTDRLEAAEAGEGLVPALIQLDLLSVALAEPGAEAKAMDRLLDRMEEAIETGGPDERLDARLDRAWIQAAMAVRPTEEAELALEQAGGRFADADPRRELAAGWIAHRNGDDEAAGKAFQAARALPMAQLGLAEAVDASDPERLRLLRGLASGGDPLASVIATRMLKENGRSFETTPVGRAILDVMYQKPSPLWRMEVAREPLMDLQASVEPVKIDPFLPARLVLKLTNLSRLPVAMGNDQTLRPVVFASVALFEGETALSSLPTQVFNIGRRLTLQPGESMTVPARLDHGPIGRRLAREPGNSFNFGFSVTLDPRLAPNGSIAIGPLGAVETLRGLQASGQEVTEASVRSWLDAMSGDSLKDEYIALIRLAMLQGGDAGGLVGPRLFADTAELLAERGPELGPVPLALCGLYLNAGTRRDPAVESVLAAARTSQQDVVRVSTLIGQVRDPTDPALDAAVRTGSPRLRRFAEAWTLLLEATDPVRSNSSPVPAGVTPG